MPHFIDKPVVNGRRIYVVANETTVGEKTRRALNVSRLAPPPSTSGMRRHWRTSRPFRICRASTLSARAWKEASGVRSFAKLSMLAPTAFRRHARPRSSTSRRRSGSRCPARPMRRRFAPTRSSVTRCFRVTARPERPRSSLCFCAPIPSVQTPAARDWLYLGL